MMVLKSFVVAGSFYEMGRQRGKQIKSMLVDVIPTLDRLQSLVPQLEMLKIMSQTEEAVHKYYPEYLDELRGMADGSGLSYQDIMRIISAHDIQFAIIAHALHAKKVGVECTSFVATGKATVDEEAVMGSNKDMNEDYKRYSFVEFMKPSSGPAMVNFVNLFGMMQWGNVNEHGISMTSTGVKVKGIRATLPSAVKYRLTLGSKNLSDASDMWASLPSGTGCNVCITDGRDLILYEVAPSKINLEYDRPGESACAVITNHFVSSKMKDIDMSGKYESSYTRRSRMIELLGENFGEISVAKAIEFMRDHDSGPSQNSVCRHRDKEPIESVSSIIVKAAKKKMWVCSSNPCQGEYEEYTL